MVNAPHKIASQCAKPRREFYSPVRFASLGEKIPRKLNAEQMWMSSGFRRSTSLDLFAIVFRHRRQIEETEPSDWRGCRKAGRGDLATQASIHAPVRRGALCQCTLSAPILLTSRF